MLYEVITPAPGGSYQDILRLKRLTLLVGDDFMVGFFFQGPLVGLLVIRRVYKAEPFFVVLAHEVASVVETREAGFFTELDMTGVSLNCVETMDNFPCSEQFMQVTGSNFLKSYNFV